MTDKQQWYKLITSWGFDIQPHKLKYDIASLYVADQNNILSRIAGSSMSPDV